MAGDVTSPSAPSGAARPDLLLWGALAVFAAWTLMSLTWPLHADSSIFAWIGDTVLRGGRPYADALDMKGPAAWLPSLLVQALVGRTSWGIRVFDALLVGATLWSMRTMGRALHWEGVGRVGIVLFALWVSGFDYELSAQPEGFVACWLFLACALAVHGAWWRLLLAGGLVGLATMSKPFFVGFLVPLWIIVIWQPAVPRVTRATAAGWVLLGAALAIAGCVALLVTTGGLDAYIEVQRWNREVYAGLNEAWTTRFPALFRGTLELPWGPVLLIALFGATRLKGADRRVVLALAVALAGAYAGLVLQNKMQYRYQWLPTLPFLAILADRGFAALRAETAGGIAGRIRRSVLAVAVLVAVWPPVERLTTWGVSRWSAESRERYEREHFPFWGRYSGSLYTVVDSLKGHGLRDSSLLVWAPIFGPQFLAGVALPNRLAVTRVFYDGPGTPQQLQFRNEVLQAMRTAPPRWWLIPRRQPLRAFRFLEAWGLGPFPALRALRDCAYRPAGMSRDWEIFERRASDMTACP